MAIALGGSGTAPAARIDTHQHVVPPAYRKLLDDRGLTAGRWPTLHCSPEAAIATMDREPIAAGILLPGAPGVHLADDAKGRDLVRLVDEYGAELVKDRPDRLGQFASIPLPDIDGAVAEAVYALDDLGASGVILLSNAGGRYSARRVRAVVGGSRRPRRGHVRTLAIAENSRLLRKGELMSDKKVLAIPVIVAALTAGSAAFAAASANDSTRNDPTYKVCVKLGLVYGAKANGACPAGSVGALINSRGPLGPRGLQGARGAAGPQGPAGVVYDCTALPYPGIDLAGCSLKKANLSGANLAGANLAGANLTASGFDSLVGANLTGANLTGANLTGANLTGAGGDTGQYGANLTGADLTAADLTHALMTDAILRGANLTDADLTGASLANGGSADALSVDLTGADLTGANLTGASLRGADLTGANLSSANLTGANLSSANLAGVTWSNTACPDGTNSGSDNGTCVNHL